MDGPAGEEDPHVFTVFKQELGTSAVPIAAVKALTNVIAKSNATTFMQLETELKSAADILKRCAREHDFALKASITLSVISELFNRYVTGTHLDLRSADFELLKRTLVERGEKFAELSVSSRQKIALLACQFVRNGSVVLLHGHSRVVMEILLAASRTKQFSVVVTESRPDFAGRQTAKQLLDNGIPVKYVVDSAVAYIMADVDMVIVGSEGIVENGGSVNKIGTYQVAIVAKSLNKPFYVAAESYKFTRLFPLNQHDLPNAPMDSLEKDKQQEQRSPSSNTNGVSLIPFQADTRNPTSDYTPPEYVTLLFTDLGVLTPSAVSDELIKLYQ